jgi:hypothetical protein
MGTPRFHPASIFENRRDFGRNPNARPIFTPELSPGERAWAIYQHQVATLVIRELHRRRHSIMWLTQELGENYDWLIRKLYGRVPADLGEIFEWALCLGVQVLPVIDVGGGVHPQAL